MKMSPENAREWRKFAWILSGFLVCVSLPVGIPRFDNAVLEALHLARWYAREHVLLCLVPAFFIAGAIAVFVRKESVMRYLGGSAPRFMAYATASISGTVLAVCSCTVLPLFTGIYRMGAGLGPAVAFLYSGPAINVLAILLTARVLGWRLGLARAVGAILFSVAVGLLMAFFFRREEEERIARQAASPAAEHPARPLWKTASFFLVMIAILVMANWARSGDVRAVFLCCPTGLRTLEVQGTLVTRDNEKIVVMTPNGHRRTIPRKTLREFHEVSNPWNLLYQAKWGVVVGLLVLLGVLTARWFSPDERREWISASWDMAKLILPLLLFGVLAAGFFLGRPGREGIIPSAWVSAFVGGNSIRSNLAASVLGAFMYFATLTEVPILRGLLDNGMGSGPALALLLAGPALSLPNMLVIRSVLGTRKTVTYVFLVIVMATLSGLLFGMLAP